MSYPPTSSGMQNDTLSLDYSVTKTTGSYVLNPLYQTREQQQQQPVSQTQPARQSEQEVMRGTMKDELRKVRNMRPNDNERLGRAEELLYAGVTETVFRTLHAVAPADIELEHTAEVVRAIRIPWGRSMST